MENTQSNHVRRSLVGHISVGWFTALECDVGYSARRLDSPCFEISNRL